MIYGLYKKLERPKPPDIMSRISFRFNKQDIAVGLLVVGDFVLTHGATAVLA